MCKTRSSSSPTETLTSTPPYRFTCLCTRLRWSALRPGSRSSWPSEAAKVSTSWRSESTCLSTASSTALDTLVAACTTKTPNLSRMRSSTRGSTCSSAHERASSACAVHRAAWSTREPQRERVSRGVSSRRRERRGASSSAELARMMLSMAVAEVRSVAMPGQPAAMSSTSLPRTAGLATLKAACSRREADRFRRRSATADGLSRPSAATHLEGWSWLSAARTVSAPMRSPTSASLPSSSRPMSRARWFDRSVSTAREPAAADSIHASSRLFTMARLAVCTCARVSA
mmetsp:Transcript_3490/g.9932  ORF Transcript_3490/g.9932 Transcript_3490/m.9932 type:complete len:287 (-) Transcript_3490:298-1158(-)